MRSLLRILRQIHAPKNAALLRDTGLLVLRAAFFLALALTYGWSTFSAFPAHAADFPDPLGLGPALSMGLVAFAELFCSLAVAVGLATRIAALPLVISFGVAFLVFHAGDAFGEKELAFHYLAAATAVLLAGPGCCSPPSPSRLRALGGREPAHSGFFARPFRSRRRARLRYPRPGARPSGAARADPRYAVRTDLWKRVPPLLTVTFLCSWSAPPSAETRCGTR